MLSRQPDLLIEGEPETPFGLRVSAVLLIAFGCFLGLYVPFYAALFIVSIVHGSRVHGHSDNVSSLIVSVVAGTLTYLCFRAAAALRQSRRWAAYVAMGFGLLLLLFSAVFIYDCFHPERQGLDEGFAILIVPFFIAAGLWWCIYLNLPQVRTRMKGIDPKA